MYLMTIGEVSAAFQVSARMLRYYEQAGLLESARRKGYAYRVYDADAVQRVRQILFLRKLQIPLKEIGRMIDGDKEESIRILQAHIRDIDDGEAALRAMKKGLEGLLRLLCEDATGQSPTELMRESMVEEWTETLPLKKHQFKEEKAMRSEKEMAEKGSGIRIVLLPPCTVAAYQCAGDAPEEAAGEVMNNFIRSTGLYEKKPDARLFGFNNPDPEPGEDQHGYEEWLTIPDDMEVPVPLTKKHFPGGMYAAYTINFPDFHEWNFFKEWIQTNPAYEADYQDPARKTQGGCMEEYLNSVYSSHMGWPENGIDGQVDLLLPIKRRK